MKLYKRLIQMLYDFRLSGGKRQRSTEDGVTIIIYRVLNKEGRLVTRIDVFERPNCDCIKT